jgi:hypothetical protein
MHLDFFLEIQTNLDMELLEINGEKVIGSKNCKVVEGSQKAKWEMFMICICWMRNIFQ